MKNKYLELAATITATGAIMAFVFSVYFKPQIEKMLKPLEVKIEYMNYVLTKYIPPDKMDQAVKEYDRIRIQRRRP